MGTFLKAGVVSLAMILLSLSSTGRILFGQEQTELSEIQVWLDYADSLRRADKPDSAIVVSKAALEQIERELGKSHPLYVSCLRILADSYSATDDYQERVKYNESYFRVAEPDSAIDRAVVARVGYNLGQIFRFLDRFSEGELYLRKTLEIMEDTSVFRPHESANLLKELAVVCLSQLRYAEAESLLRKAIGTCQQAHKTDDHQFAAITNALGYLFFDRGLYAQAESLYNIGKKIRETRGGSWDHSLSESLNNLGEVYEVWGRFAEAESLYLRALRIRERGMGYHHPYLYYHLANLGELYACQGRYAEADYYLNRALKIASSAYGGEHSQVARCTKALGDLYRRQGDYRRAESFYLRALETNRKIFGFEHPDVTDCLSGLALLYGSMGDYAKSLSHYKELLETKLSLIENIFSYASEQQKMRFADQYALVDGSLLSLSQMDTSRESRTHTLEMTLKGKAIVIDALSAERQMAHCLYDDHIAATEQQHKLICGKISTMTLANMRKGKVQPEYIDTLQTLHSTKDSLETVLSRVCSSFGEQLTAQRFTVNDVAAALPDGSVLWEFVRYEPYDFRKRGSDQEKTGLPRYLAFTLDRSANVTLTDLGDAAIIDSLVSLAKRLIYEYRTLTSHSAVESERRLNQVAGKLYEVVFAPLEVYLDGRTDIFISPDGQLNLLPFEIIPCPDGSYVVERFSISYLSSGRDVLRFRRIQERKNRALVMGDPDFDLSQQRRPGHTGTLPVTSTSSLVSFEPARGTGGCLLAPFPGLPLTRKEAESVTRTLRENGAFSVDIHLDAEASEEVLKNMPAPPDVLHLATHAYFCEDPDLGKNAIFENPLLRCGLALAGANGLIKGKQEAKLQGEDGILTALEASGLNLVGTELVVLSACETGVGEIKNGEGVYGLRRAFQCAGAGTILMSLWKVDDTETCDLMNQFYENWLTGHQSKKEALREAALKILNDRRARNESTHPLFWGGFVTAGDPN
jgi:CHAT domain-containing protein/tetratricopeptide (TPR) repeat protein